MKVIGGGYLNENDLRERGLSKVGQNVKVHESAVLVDVDNIQLGSNVRVDQFCVLSAAGGHIEIGSYVHVGAQCLIYGGAGVRMGDFSGLSHGVRLYSVSDDYSGASLTNPTIPATFLQTKRGPINVGRHVIIGSGSVVLPGSNLYEGVAVGALSLVNGDLKEWTIYAGIPARPRSPRDRKLLEQEASLKKAVKDTPSR